MGRTLKNNLHLKAWSRRLAVVTSALFMGGAGLGQLPDLAPGEVGKVSSVLDGDTLYLEGGMKVRLSAMQAPKLPLGRKGFKAWPLGTDSRAALRFSPKDKLLGFIMAAKGVIAMIGL